MVTYEYVEESSCPQHGHSVCELSWARCPCHNITHYSLRRGRRAGDVGGRSVNKYPKSLLAFAILRQSGYNN